MVNQLTNKSTLPAGGSGPKPLTIQLVYRPPYDWHYVLAFFQAHKIPYLETIDGASYERVIETSRGLGWFQVCPDAPPDRNGLRVSLWNGTREDLNRVAEAVRRMFDLDADPAVLRATMTGDPYLKQVWTRSPGLRVSRAWSGFESMMTTILGQLVSVSFGRVLIKELMDAAGSPARHPRSGENIFLFPTANGILDADLAHVRTSPMRRASLRSVASLVAEGALDWKQPLPGSSLKKALRAVAGVGPWTAEYVALRGFADNDAFPATDYCLKQQLKRHPEIDPDRLRPWRAYAAVALWKGFADEKRESSGIAAEGTALGAA